MYHKKMLIHVNVKTIRKGDACNVVHVIVLCHLQAVSDERGIQGVTDFNLCSLKCSSVKCIPLDTCRTAYFSSEPLFSSTDPSPKCV